jgi:hypothetical protein
MAATADDGKHRQIRKARHDRIPTELKGGMAGDEAKPKDAGGMDTEEAETDNKEVTLKPQSVEPTDADVDAAGEHGAMSTIGKLASDVAQQALGEGGTQQDQGCGAHLVLAQDRRHDHQLEILLV